MEQSDLNEVLVFTRVVQAGSFTAAARKLTLPKSTVSRRVTSLEKRLGVRLLQRTTRRLRLTDVGREYYARVSRVVDDLEEADNVVRASQDRPLGTLRITAPVDLGLEYLSRLINEFTALYPEVNVSLFLTQRKVDLVGEGFDLALRAGQMTDSTLISKKISGSPARLWASPGYLAARGTPTTPEDLADHDCVLFGSELRGKWRLVDGKHEVEVPVAGRIAANDLLFVRRAAEAGAGIALIPLIPSADPVSDRLVPVLERYRSNQSRNVGLFVVYPSAKHLSPKARVFIDFVSDRMKNMMGA